MITENEIEEIENYFKKELQKYKEHGYFIKEESGKWDKNEYYLWIIFRAIKENEITSNDIINKKLTNKFKNKNELINETKKFLAKNFTIKRPTFFDL